VGLEERLLDHAGQVQPVPGRRVRHVGAGHSSR
jgi:hypothetical protein